MLGTTFGMIHSATDLLLIQQSIEVNPAEPKTNLVEIPGANGSKDLTEALGVGVKYADRKIEWTFALRPGANWAERRAAVSNAINGKRMQITPDDEPEWYYEGRIAVSGHETDGLLHQIAVTAVCAPYRRKKTESTVARNDLSTAYKNLVCEIGAMPLIPIVTVEQETTLKWGDVVVTVATGTHSIPSFYMSGTQTVKAKTTSGSGTITIKWREGSL